MSTLFQQEENIFVKGLDLEWTESDLCEIFDQYGPIRSAKVSVNPVTHKSKGYGYVCFESPASATKAIRHSMSGETPYQAQPYRPPPKKIDIGSSTNDAQIEELLSGLLTSLSENGGTADDDTAATPSTVIESALLPGMASIEDAILVTGFDDDTKEEELIEFYYRIVYGGGTRNINDGKVKACQIFTIPIKNQSEYEVTSEMLSQPNHHHRVAIITFADVYLASDAISNQFNKQFKGRQLFAEPCKSESLLIKRILETFSTQPAES